MAELAAQRPCKYLVSVGAADRGEHKPAFSTEPKQLPEIAQITGSSIPAVRSHLFRGRRTLTEKLQEWR